MPLQEKKIDVGFVLVFPIMTFWQLSAFLKLPRTLTYPFPLQPSSEGKRDFPE